MASSIYFADPTTSSAAAGSGVDLGSATIVQALNQLKPLADYHPAVNDSVAVLTVDCLLLAHVSVADHACMKLENARLPSGDRVKIEMKRQRNDNCAIIALIRLCTALAVGSRNASRKRQEQVVPLR